MDLTKISILGLSVLLSYALHLLLSYRLSFFSFSLDLFPFPSTPSSMFRSLNGLILGNVNYISFLLAKKE